jgi:hypothetical protein
MPGLIIREEQMQVWRNEKFVHWIVQEVRKDHAATLKGTPAYEVEAKVRHGLQRGRMYGLTSEPALADFVFSMFLISPVFDEHPPIRKIFLDQAIPEERKLQQIQNTLTVDDWKAARRVANPDVAWRSLPVLMS